MKTMKTDISLRTIAFETFLKKLALFNKVESQIAVILNNKNGLLLGLDVKHWEDGMPVLLIGELKDIYQTNDDLSILFDNKFNSKDGDCLFKFPLKNLQIKILPEELRINKMSGEKVIMQTIISEK